MFPRRFLVAGVLLAGITARANPVATTPADEVPLNIYMASENLRVTISPTDAVFNASFTFKSDRTPNKNTPVVVRLPIWFPQDSKEDLSVAEFWATFDKDNEAGDAVSTAREKRVFDRAIGLNISAGKHRLVVEHPDYFLATPTNWGPGNVTSTPYLRNPPFFEDVPREELQSPGYGILVIVVWSDSNTVLKGKPVTMTYRQPLVRSEGKGHFFYLPIFEYMPKDVSTADTNHYSITLAATPECSLAITARSKKVMVARGQSVTLGADRHTPIQAVVDCPGFSPKIPVQALSDLYRYKTNFDDGEFFRGYSNRLCLFVVRQTPVAGARYVDLPGFSRLGFIKEEPDLIITNLLSVEAGKTSTYTRVAGKLAVVEDPVIELGLHPKDCEGVESLMNRNINSPILATYKGRLLAAPEAMPAYRLDEIAWGVTNNADLKNLVHLLQPLVK